MSAEIPDAERFLTLVSEMKDRKPQLSRIQAAILVASEQGIAGDSRTFSRVFEIAHALVLRELNALAGLDMGLDIVRRDLRTMRTYYDVR